MWLVYCFPLLIFLFLGHVSLVDFLIYCENLYMFLVPLFQISRINHLRKHPRRNSYNFYMVHIKLLKPKLNKQTKHEVISLLVWAHSPFFLFCFCIFLFGFIYLFHTFLLFVFFSNYIIFSPVIFLSVKFELVIVI